MYHVEGGVNDRGKSKADRSVERMALRVGHVWIQGRSVQYVESEGN